MLTLREGLRLRRARLLRSRADSGRHRGLARIFVALAVVGFGLGLASMGLLRGEPIFESVHSILVTAALGALLLAAGLGLGLERGRVIRLRNVHALCGAGGLLLALAAGAAAFAILP